jgi:hypothetical protein
MWRMWLDVADVADVADVELRGSEGAVSETL